MIYHPFKCEPKAECSECLGAGEREYEVMCYGGPPGAYSPYQDVVMECHVCQGSGEIDIEEEFDEEDV